MFSKQYRALFAAMLGLVAIAFSGLGQAEEKSLLWKIESPAGQHAYLFGTMHTDDKRITTLSPKVVDAVKEADVFVMETLPPRNPSIYLMKDNTKLSEYLVEKEFDKVHELAEFHSMHMEAAMRMKPWLLAMIFDMPKPQTFETLDESLASLARDNEKKIIGLEDPQEHFGMMDEMTMDEQLVMLRAVLNKSQKQKQQDFESLIKAYQKGDANKIAALDDKTTGAMLPKELWQKMRTKLIDERNVTMFERMQLQMNDATSFFAVGASHLAGADGLLARFKNAGYKLTAM